MTVEKCFGMFLVPKLRLGTPWQSSALRLEAELRRARSQAELGNEESNAADLICESLSNSQSELVTQGEETPLGQPGYDLLQSSFA